MNGRLKDRIGAAAFALFGLLWMIAAARQQYFVDTPHVSLSFLPIVAGGLLTILAGYTALRPEAPAAAVVIPPESSESDEGTPGNRTLHVILVFVALLIYAALMPHVHSLVVTFLLMVAGLALCGEPLRPRLLIIAAVIALLLYGIFVMWLAIPVPGSRFG